MTQETYTQGHHESVLRSHTSRNVANPAGYLTGELRVAGREPEVQSRQVRGGRSGSSMEAARSRAFSASPMRSSSISRSIS